jgi:hypothetical protein
MSVMSAFPEGSLPAMVRLPLLLVARSRLRRRRRAYSRHRLAAGLEAVFAGEHQIEEDHVGAIAEDLGNPVASVGAR